MNRGIVLSEKLERLLQSHWVEILDHVRLMRVIAELVRDTSFKVIEQAEIPQRHIKMSVTSFKMTNHGFEVWVEYSVPKGDGVVIGTSTFLLCLSGELELKETFGIHFVPQTS